MELKFEGKNRIRVISTPNSREETIKDINKFCDDRNFKINYIRSWKINEYTTKFDVGSWSEFFLLEDKWNSLS